MVATEWVRVSSPTPKGKGNVWEAHYPDVCKRPIVQSTYFWVAPGDIGGMHSHPTLEEGGDPSKCPEILHLVGIKLRLIAFDCLGYRTKIVFNMVLDAQKQPIMVAIEAPIAHATICLVRGTIVEQRITRFNPEVSGTIKVDCPSEVSDIINNDLRQLRARPTAIPDIWHGPLGS